jgi:hypothetical protein
MGPQGPQGSPGVQGAKGDRGCQGPAGPAGQAGPQGQCRCVSNNVQVNTNSSVAGNDLQTIRVVNGDYTLTDQDDILIVDTINPAVISLPHVYAMGLGNTKTKVYRIKNVRANEQVVIQAASGNSINNGSRSSFTLPSRHDVVLANSNGKWYTFTG